MNPAPYASSKPKPSKLIIWTTCGIVGVLLLALNIYALKTSSMWQISYQN